MVTGNRTCPQCRSENAPDSKFCQECGTQLLQIQEIPSLTKTLEIPKDNLTTGAVFAGRYQVIEELGKGGMGKVYKALDQKLNEEVALKLIRPEIAPDRRTLERFSSELKMARKIVHKNVGRVYELMEDHGVHFITMEYVKGQDLKDLIRQTGRLTIGKAVSTIRQVCEGLAEAHRMGIVHRDLKPGNIMIDKDGDARIMDFGIARSVHARSVTGEGVIVGTPDYMSPEQVEGQEADQRSDIYSLGIILYEMVTGRVPFTGDTPLTVAVKHKTETPRDPAEINPLVPEDLSRIIMKCLEKAREARYQSAEELRAALAGLEEGLPTTERALAQTRRAKSTKAAREGGRSGVKTIALYGGAFVLLALLIYAGFSLLNGRKEAMDSIAVLPLENVGRNPDVEAYCQGIADDVRENLSRTSRSFKDASRRLKVISRSSTIGYKDKAIDPKEVGRDLDVRTLLTGTVTQKGDKLSVRAELVRTGDGSVIMERTFERETREIFSLEDIILAAVLEGLGLSQKGSQEASARPIANVKAYEYYLKAMSLEYSHPEQGMKYLENAMDITGDNPFLYAAMAEVGGIQAALFDVTRQDAHLAKAEEYANKALSLEPGLPWAHVVLGYLYSQFRGDQPEGLRHFKRALVEDPEDTRALEGLILTDIEYFGKLEEGAALVQRLKAVDPRNWCVAWASGGLEFFGGRYPLALEPWRRMIGVNPGAPDLFWYALALIYNRRIDEALQTIDQNAAEFAASTFAQIGLLWKWALQGNGAAAGRVLNPDFEKACRGDADWARNVGVVMAVLGDRPKALDWLQNAVDRGFLNYAFLENDPFLESLRGEARFKKIIDQARRELETIPN